MLAMDSFGKKRDRTTHMQSFDEVWIMISSFCSFCRQANCCDLLRTYFLVQIQIRGSYIRHSLLSPGLPENLLLLAGRRKEQKLGETGMNHQCHIKTYYQEKGFRLSHSHFIVCLYILTIIPSDSVAKQLEG